MRYFLLLFLLIPTSAVRFHYTGPSPAPQAADNARETSPEIRRKTFDIVWQTVKDELFDPAIRGIDWENARQRYAPRVETVETDNELYSLINEMLGELHLSHLGVFSYEEASKHTSALGSIGIDIRMVENQAVIIHVKPRSTAHRAGLRRGFVVTGVDGESIQQIEKVLAHRPGRDTYVARALLEGLQGDPGSPVALAYLDAENRPHEKRIVRERKKGELTPVADYLPAFYAEFESRRLKDGTGYIRFNSFVPGMGKRVERAVAGLRGAPAIILDLRGNAGGFDQVMTVVAGSFVPKGTVISTSNTRKGITHYKAEAEKSPYAGALLILIDELTVSAAEELAAGLQEMGRALLVGETTAGLDLDTEIKTLPTGGLFWYPSGDGRTPKGVLIEGRGVTPDIRVTLTRAAVQRGIDLSLTEAIKHLRNTKTSRRR